MEFYQKIKQFTEKFHMLSPQAGVLVGLSGGADSVALLQVLCRMREEVGLRLFAVHVHHGIRSTAQRDADFCEMLCKQKDVEFVCEKADVTAFAKEQGITVEEAGRKLRYDIFERYRVLKALDAIAVAHHKNDQAETILFQLFRGSGIKGLTGIPYQRDYIIRPLLAVSREEIEVFLEQQGLDYVTDETNVSDIYSRNKIRHHILPMAEEVCAGAIDNMNRASTILKEVQDFMEEESRAFLERHAEHCEYQISVSVTALKERHIALQKYIILAAIEHMIKCRKDITERHVEGILSLLETEGEKSIDLPRGLLVKKQYDMLLFCKERVAERENALKQTEISVIPGNVYLFADGRWLEATLIEDNNLENIPKSNCTKWFDYDKISNTLLVRTRQAGDYLTIDEKEAQKSLQDYLVNEKVPKSMRDEVLVLADDHHIVWVLGKRISTHYKVTEHTKRILQIHIGGMERGRESRNIIG